MKRVILLVMLFALSMGGGFLTLFLLNGVDEQTVRNEAVAIQQEVTLESENGTLVNPDFAPDEKDPYWQFSKMGVLKVDLSGLAKKNPDVKGWVQVGGTSVDFPFVQESSTEAGFYKDHSFNRERNKSGWVYLEAGTPADFSAENTILYSGGTLLSELTELLTNGWLTDRAHFVVKTYSIDASAGQIWEIFSIYRDGVGDNAYKSGDFQEMERKTLYSFGATPEQGEKIITLVAPIDEKENMVIHAKLIKQG